MTETLRLPVGAADAGARVDRVLAAGATELSRSRIKALVAAGHLSIDGATVTDPAHRVKAGTTLTLTVPPAAPPRPEGQAMALDVVYEDAALIVVDKPAGLVVHPAPGNPDGTLVNALIAHCGDSLTGIGGEQRPGIVHRLDKETSGLVVAAKTEHAHAALVEQFAARTIARTYTAVVSGVPAPATGTFTGAIGRDPRNRKRMAVVERGGRPAETRYTVERVLAGGAAAILACTLKTGRTHQLRVHLAHAEHPILGDPTYTGRRRGRALPPAARQRVAALGRQALHARSLEFYHPVTGAWLAFERGAPPDIDGLINTLAES